MKFKFLSLLLAVVFCISCLSLFACSQDDNEGVSGTESSSPEEETLPPPLDFADGDDLSFEINSDNQSYSVIGLLYEAGAIKIEIPSTFADLPVTGISASAFSSSQYLESILIPDTVTHIGSYAFDGCTQLSDMQLSKNLEYVGEAAFDGCDSLLLTEYDNALYLGSKSAPYTVLYSAVDGNIESCTVHEDTKIIYDYAFCECYDLDEISLPNGILQIGMYAFEECWDLFPNNPHNGAFYLGNDENPYLVLVNSHGKKMTELTVETGTKIIAPGAFEGCSELNTVTIPDSVSVIGAFAFEGCSALTDVNVTESTWCVINSEAVHYPLSVSTTAEDFIKDLTEIYYYCTWIND